MAIKVPSFQDIYNKIKASIFSNTQGALEVEKDPFARSFSVAQTQVMDHLYKTSQDMLAQVFAQSATKEEFLNAIAFDRTNNQISRKTPEYAYGTLVVIGSSGTDIPQDTQFITSDGNIYKNLIDRVCATQSFVITSLERVSNYAIATLEDHGLGSNMTINISGADSGFNGDQQIEVLTKDTFRYVNTGSDIASSGTIIGSFIGCKVDVQSINASLSANKTFTDIIDLAAGIDGVSAVYMTFSGITGGLNIEDLMVFRSRIVEFLANPENKGNKNQHQTYIKQKTDANYAYFFQSEDNFYIYLTGIISKRDSNFNFSNFSSDELTAIKAQFIAENQLLLGVEALNLSIANPTFVNINVTITDLSPNTLEMKSAISLVLKEYLSLLPINFYLSSSKVEVGTDKLKTVMALARDSNGNTPSASDLTVSGSANLNTNVKKPILGSITYS